ncbi:MAG: EamA family transporter, partial [Paracoccaceae bacterium]
MRGAGLMVASMAGFAVEDAFLKASARHLPLGQVMIVMGLCGMAVFAAMSLRRGERPLPRGVLAPMMLARSASEIAGRLFYTLAVALTPLSSASAILQATPLVVIAGAALLFRERVGAARWLAVALGFL